MGADPHAKHGGNAFLSITHHYVSSGLNKINFTENDKAFCKLIINDKWGVFEFPYIDDLFGTCRDPEDYEHLLPLLLAAGDSPHESNCGDWMRTDYHHSKFPLSRHLLQLGRAINGLEQCGLEENDLTNRAAILEQAKVLRNEIPAMIESKSTANFEAKLNEFHQNKLLGKVPNYQAVLANIGLAILGLVVFYLIAAGIHAAKTHGKHFFFFTQTNGQKKCDKIENITKNISQQMKK
jgi:hypothetical protein